MTSIITLSAVRSPAESAAWSAFLNARLAYMEHQSNVTRVAVQSAFQAFALSMGLSLAEARAASARLDAVNSWEQSPDILIGALH
jgi:hypothetical protein